MLTARMRPSPSREDHPVRFKTTRPSLMRQCELVSGLEGRAPVDEFYPFASQEPCEALTKGRDYPLVSGQNRGIVKVVAMDRHAHLRSLLEAADEMGHGE